MKKQIDIIGVASVMEPKMTKFMQAADLFQPYKVIAELIEVHYVIKYEGPDFTIDGLRKYISIGLKMAMKEFGKNLVFCHIQNVQQNDIKIENMSTVPFVSSEVSVVSDGDKYGLVVNMVKSFCKGIEIEEGEIRKIKSLTWPQPEKTSIDG